MFKVLLIDRCYFSRFGLKLWLEKSADLSVNFYVVETDNLLFAREHILKHQPNIVLADFHGFISELHNLHQLSSIASACGNITRLIVMQSQHSPPELVDYCQEMGAWRTIDKSLPLHDIHALFQEAIVSRPPFGPTRTLAPLLTLREEKILKLWEQEVSNEIIARQMGITKKTVYTYKRNIRMKLGANNRLTLFLSSQDAG